MNEFELIKLLTTSLPTNSSVVTGAGDDCAVLDFGLPGQWLLFKTDAVVEGIHFTKEARPEQIGHKALARCLSDFAAMAGTPTTALITLGLPTSFRSSFVEAIYAGMKTLAQRYQVAIVGGETTANPERLFISLAVVGTVPRDKCVLRSGAQAGDAIFVTGELGGALAGKHLDFEPRLKEARWLAERFAIHSMIDLSDGLAGDLRHLLGAGKVGAELLTSAIPVSPVARRSTLHAPRSTLHAPPSTLHAPPSTPHAPPSTPHAPPSTPLLAALTDGEDFELLFTAPSKDAVRLLDAWKKRFPGLRLSCIGKITAQPGLKLRDKSGVKSLTAHGYVHFA